MILKFIYTIFFIKIISSSTYSQHNFNFFHSKWKGNKFNTLMFEGGGIKN